MRLEINIADERPEAKILSAISDPSAFVLDLVRRSGEVDKPKEVPDYVAIVDRARQSPNRFRTPAEVDGYLSELRAEW